MTDAEREGYFRELYAALLSGLQRGEGGPFAAGVVLENRLVAVGTNSVLGSRDVSRHAEINALAAALERLGPTPAGVHLAGAELLSTHFPCLMCYHAAKWARIGRIHYLFDYEETEDLFGFRGDRAMLRQLGLPFERLTGDASLPSVRVRSPGLDRLYRVELPRLWNERYRATGSGYDIPDVSP